MDTWAQLVSRYPVLKGKRKGMVKCPCHDDRMASLSLKQADDGGVLVHCFAGCDWRAIHDALGITRDVTSRPNAGSIPAPPKRRVVAEYRYRDYAGDTLAVKQRWTLPGGEKTFTWLALHPDGQLRMQFPDGMSQHDLPLYRLPECVALTRQGAPLLVVEGEKDADTLAALGFAATTHAAGASGAGSAYDPACYVPFFPPGRVPVVILPDHDAPGERHARRLADALMGAGYTVRVWAWGEREVPPKGDVTDWVTARQADGTDATVIALQIARRVRHAPLWVPDPDPSQPLPDADAIEERAAILEHDAGYPRAVAERVALADVRHAETAHRAALPASERVALGTDDPELAAILRRAKHFAPA